ncbi:unnamed protein product [Polarella glacialis]|uniref:Uncharacterized protein n=1 Tax=Polarella glacialis TaxID=89957 RepID=A0A813FQL8_POLGL|nr:unnamed protein product [Polarella glacialis]
MVVDVGVAAAAAAAAADEAEWRRVYVQANGVEESDAESEVEEAEEDSESVVEEADVDDDEEAEEDEAVEEKEVVVHVHAEESVPVNKQALIRDAAIQLVLSEGIAAMARMGLRCGLGGHKASLRAMRLYTHPDKNGRSAESTAASHQLADISRDFENMSTRSLKQFRDLTSCYSQEEDLVARLADANGFPRLTRMPSANAESDPRCPPGPDVSALPPQYELIDLQSIEDIMNMTASRTFMLPCGSPLFNFLDLVRRRASLNPLVAPGIGRIQVPLYEGQCVDGLRGRGFTGCSSATPPGFAAEAVLSIPQAYVGASVFQFPKVVKYICRRGLRTIDVDAASCYYNILANLMKELHIEATPIILSYLNDRAAMLHWCCQDYQVSGDEAKRLFLRIGFLGSFDTWLAENNKKALGGKFDGIIHGLKSRAPDPGRQAHRRVPRSLGPDG